jgi:hypothetical protein
MAKGRIEYLSADRFSLEDIPKEYIPTERVFYILGVIILFSWIISAFTFPIGDLMSGKENFTINVGYPKPMLSLGNSEMLPFNFGGIFLDLALFFVIALTLEIGYNITRARLRKAIYDRNVAPRLYKKVN